MANLSIFQGLLQPPKSVADYDMQAAQLQGQQLQNSGRGIQNQTAQLTNQKTQTDLDRSNQLLALSRGLPQGSSDLDRLSAMRNAGFYDQADALSKTLDDRAKSGATAAKDNASAADTSFKTQQAKRAAKLQAISQFSSPEDAKNHLASGVQDGSIPMAEATQMIQKVPTDPAEFQKWQLSTMRSLLTPEQQTKLTTPDANSVLSAQTQTSNNALTNETSRANNASTVGAKIRGQDLVNARAQDGGGAEGFSPAAIENAAARYNMDGTLPPMGMGKAGSQGRQAILNRAAEINSGTPGADQRLTQIDNKASGTALTQLGKSKTMNAAFEKTANMNADMALGLSQKMDRTGIPLLNAGLQAWKTGTGSPEATQFAAANETFVAEYAKIMSGGMGNGPVSDAARSKASHLLTTAMTQPQYAGNVKLLQNEMKNRMKGFDDQADELRNQMRGGAKPAADDIHAQADAILRGK